MPGGYVGKIGVIDLTDGSVRIEDTCEVLGKKYLGGKGYALALLYEYTKELEEKGKALSDLDPLGPDNAIVFATGPATGVPGFPSPGRYHVMALRSPLTGSIGSANSGGEWGPFLKFAGFDMLFIKGAADSPV
ncbi:MAG: aldehyde ferredoxin oxidoreductase N-terminal domain-containing protein, partial [Nitrososphaeria archaeon]